MTVQIDLRREGPDAAVLRLTGRLDMLSAPELKRAVTEVVATGCTHVVVDLGAVDSIDSSGLGALIGGLRATRSAGGDLRIANANTQVMTVLGLTTLDRVLVPHESVEAALAAR